MSDRGELARELEAARNRTLAVVDLDDAELTRQYHPLMSPLVWDLAHIGQQEEFWLLRGGNPQCPGLLPAQVDSLYDAFTHSRASRVDLPLMSPTEARSYCRTVRDKAFDALDVVPDQSTFPFAMVISHEHQHIETMLQALNLRTGEPLLTPAGAVAQGRPDIAGTSVLVPGGPCVIGVDIETEPHSLDNERPAHVVDVPSFRIGRVPVTNAEWREFISDGGYLQQRFWSERAGNTGSRRIYGLPSSGPPKAPESGSGRSRTYPPASRSSMFPTSRPRHTRPGRVLVYPPKWSGRRLACGIRKPAGGGVFPGVKANRACS